MFSCYFDVYMNFQLIKISFLFNIKLCYCSWAFGIGKFYPALCKYRCFRHTQRRELCIRRSGDSQRDRHTFGICQTLLLYISNLYIYILPIIWFLDICLCDWCDVSFVSCIKSSYMFIYLNLIFLDWTTHFKGKVISIFD